MKTLTIRQPYATLIAENIKTVETRTWYTKYRGPILVHAGKGKDSKIIQQYDGIIDISKIPFGEIIAKCDIVDCIKMDKLYIEEYNNKHKGSGYYLYDNSIGKYAFVLENIKKIKNIPASGKLSFWEYNIEEE